MCTQSMCSTLIEVLTCRAMVTTIRQLQSVVSTERQSGHDTNVQTQTQAGVAGRDTRSLVGEISDVQRPSLGRLAHATHPSWALAKADRPSLEAVEAAVAAAPCNKKLILLRESNIFSGERY